MYERRIDGEEQRSGISPPIIVLILLGVAAVIFVLQNSESRSIDFLFLDFTAPQRVIFAILLAVGAALDRLVQFWMRRRKARELDPPD